MSIALTDEQTSLAEVARSFAVKNSLRSATRGALESAPAGRDAAWQKLVDLGWTGLHLPDQLGGSGFGLQELAIVVEELGAAAAAGPFVAAVTGSAVLDRCATDEVRAALLPSLADGTAIAVHADAPQVTLDADRALGSVLVRGAVWADHLLLGVGDDLVLAAAADVTMSQAVGALDPSLGLTHVTLDSTPVTVFSGQASVARSISRALAAAQACGGARATLATALDYAKVREQFGRIIGSFQAVKHHLANMLVQAECATAAAWDAARANDEDKAADQASLASAVATATCMRAFQHNAQMSIQLLGGIGFTWEHDAHLYLRRAVALAAMFDPATAERDVFELIAAGVRREFTLALPPDAEQFRSEARTFVESLRDLDAAGQRQTLVESGYLVPHWPTPFGRAASATEQLVIEQEFAGVDVPNLGIGGWVLLTLVQCANEEQIARWIRPSLAGEYAWCQLFSEPNAGSDAAAVQTKAIRVEGGWRITGQKVWTSNAQLCNRGLATVRTNPDAPKHRGVTAVVVDLTAPGVEVRPLREITGHAVFNEVFFDDVFVPDSDVVGEIDAGWAVARATLGNERVSIGGQSREAADALELVALAADASGDVRSEVGALAADEQTIRLLNLRRVARAVEGREPGAEGAVTKLLVAEHGQRATEAAIRLLGTAGVDGSHERAIYDYLMARCGTIAGGTSEISRNVIAERLLGLPREPNLR